MYYANSTLPSSSPPYLCRLRVALLRYLTRDLTAVDLTALLVWQVLRVRDRVIMEGEEMDGVFKLCLAGIMQSDIDEYKNALYLEDHNLSSYLSWLRRGFL